MDKLANKLLEEFKKKLENNETAKAANIMHVAQIDNSNERLEKQVKENNERTQN